jgi:membrane associated rhomboid family serine protease
MTEISAAQRQFAGRGRLVFVLIAVLVGIEALRHALPPEAAAQMVLTFAFVPADFARLFDPAGVMRAAGVVVSSGAATSDELAQILGSGSFRWWTPVTYAFLHGSWTHVFVNCLWLAAFGSAVARRFGTVRFLLFFAVTAVGGVAAHCLTHFYDFAPLVGASAAISGAMAGAVRFAFAPGAPLGPTASSGLLEAYQGPTLPLRAIIRDRRAMTFLVVWFVANFLFGAWISPVGLTDASIAWEAHIGGFVTGLFLFPVFDPVRTPVMPGDLPLTEAAGPSPEA